MAHEITLAQATEKASQTEAILLMMESFPDELTDSQFSDVITLVRRLAGEVHTWLIEETVQKGGG
ncbi:hypothetical protein PHA77_07800 [Edwardsiella tarda]|uniref:hypothetical protein n=1 Tax=Edwardsiella tarda TaxID=636 RepID=UPI002443B498|nr:hypothetical protein [Edwardsiella tarda]WGE30495.1 hypothetical protein PHA77_07800 [Edwardsiella tarda]